MDRAEGGLPSAIEEVGERRTVDVCLQRELLVGEAGKNPRPCLAS